MSETLVGKTINGVEVTDQTKNETWPGTFICPPFITTLEGAPKKIVSDPARNQEGDFICSRTDIDSFVGAPEEVSGDFEARGSNVVTIEGLPKKIGGRLWLNDCPHLNSLRGIHVHVKECDSISLTGLDMKSCVLGVLLLKGLHIIRGYQQWVLILRETLRKFPGDSQQVYKERLMYASRRLIDEMEDGNGKELAQL